ncbi:hypothetical protein ACS0TY_004066 [Phlomoides rotata]
MSIGFLRVPFSPSSNHFLNRIESSIVPESPKRFLPFSPVSSSPPKRQPYSSHRAVYNFLRIDDFAWRLLDDISTILDRGNVGHFAGVYDRENPNTMFFFQELVFESQNSRIKVMGNSSQRMFYFLLRLCYALRKKLQLYLIFGALCIRSRSSSLSPSPESGSPSATLNDRKHAEKLKKEEEKLKREEEEKKRLQHEAELKRLEEETARRLEEEIRRRVEEKLGSEEVKLEIERQIKEARKKLLDDIEAQLQREKEDALAEARAKEEQARREREELDKTLEENRRRVEEAQRREALELQRKEEERLRELELIQRQKEEAARRRRLEEVEERANQMLLGKNKSPR